MTQSNPLSKHCRQPAIYLRLPSQGSYWPDGAVMLPVNGELPVYPMTTKDEIMLRTPDALINGSGVVSVIQSCIPAIQDAWAMPSVDVDACLIAIRIASFGNDMNLSSHCPKCNHENEHTIELATALDQLGMPNYNETIVDSDLVIKLKPQNYYTVNRTNMISYEEQRILSIINEENLSLEEKEANLREITDKLIDLNIENLVNSTDYVLTAEGDKVTDPEYLKEFYTNTGSALIRKIQLKLGEFVESAGVKPYQTTCNECSAEYRTDVVFDYSSFFASGS